MERATGMQIFACFFKRHARVNDIDDVDPREEFINKLWRNLASHSVLLWLNYAASINYDIQDRVANKFSDSAPP
jgi:hypothetical protein